MSENGLKKDGGSGGEAPAEVTELLRAWQDGDTRAMDALIPLVYGELRRLARAKLAGERAGHSLQPTTLAHEAFLRLLGHREVSWKSRAHFYAIAARTMRRVLVDHARARGAEKRGGGATRVSLSEAEPAVASREVDVLALHEALSQLEEKDPTQCRVVELRYFGGLTVEETAEALGSSPATVKREWSFAKLWLRRALEQATA